MALFLHNIGDKKKKRKTVGRGNSSGHGTFSTRGGKGQTARSGGGKGLKLKAYRRMMLSAPKFKGMKKHNVASQVVRTATLEKNFKSGDAVNPQTLLNKRIINDEKKPIKILFDKEFSIALDVSGCTMSVTAKASLEKAGGKVLDGANEVKTKE